MTYDRLDNPRMEFYRETYKHSTRWTDKSIPKNKKIICYLEQGHGDAIHMARYFADIRANNHLILHCHQPLIRLFHPLADEIIDKESDVLPDHDCHILSLDLPFLENIRSPNTYLTATPLLLDPGKKIGIAWEGNPQYCRNLKRSCPLKHFKDLPGQLFMLQNQIHLQELVCEDVELYGYPINDFYDTARLIQSMDLVVSVDTSILHLAGALGKKTFGVLDFDHDPRWNVRPWYDSVRLFRQDVPDSWEKVMKHITNLCHHDY